MGALYHESEEEDKRKRAEKEKSMKKG